MRKEEAETIANALKIFDSLDLNFEFNSTEELPSQIKKVVGDEINVAKKELKGEVRDDENEIMNTVLELVNSVEVMGVAPNFARFHGKFQGQGFA